MTRRSVLLVLLVLGLMLVLASATTAAEPLAQSSPGDECVAGELCIPNEGNTQTGPSRRGAVSDPAGDYVISFITMAFVAVIMVVYFMVALGGRKVPFRRRAARA